MTETDNLDIRRDGNLTLITIKNLSLTPEDLLVLKAELRSVVNTILADHIVRERLSITTATDATNPTRAGWE